MERYILITPGYPREKNRYNNAFVHARVKHYIGRGLRVDVFCVDKKLCAKPKNGTTYVYEGITVEEGNVSELKKKLVLEKYDKVLIHFAIRQIVSAVLQTLEQTPVIIWSHGVDMIPWYKRMYNLRLANIIKFGGYAVLNTWQRLYLRNALRRHSDRMTFVFVSEWQKEVSQKSIWTRIKHTAVIPNIVDEKVFIYHKKNTTDRLKILSIRSFRSKNYANDLTVKAIQAIALKPYFNDLHFTICGDGRLWNKTVKPIMDYPNVILKRGFFSHDEIAKLHREHGVILMPSRQDTHGVSTSEAMSSGLVPITSNNSAIPEFVSTNCGYLADNFIDIANAITDIYENPDKFVKFSKEAAQSIQKKCASTVVIDKEMGLIRG